MRNAMKNPAYVIASVLLVASSLLTGCAGLNSKFDCPMKPGVMCESLDKVNTQVDQGVLGGSEGSDCPTCHAHSASASQVSVNPNFRTPYPMAAMNPGDPVRYGETVMRIWFAPFEDKDGNYHQPNIIYTVIKPGHWIGQPVKAITGEGDDA